jgi:hypothetical protein
MKLFYDDEFDALTAAIHSSGKPFKLVAAHLFPDMRPESAYARLKSCTSTLGDQRLTFGQVIRLMVFCGTFDPLMYACSETGHAPPELQAPEDEAAHLASIIKEASQTIERAARALEQSQARTGRA